MKYFYATIITQYDGFEWVEQAVATAKNKAEAEQKFNSEDWTHDNGVEIQEPAQVQEISQAEYQVLSKYLVASSKE